MRINRLLVLDYINIIGFPVLIILPHWTINPPDNYMLHWAIFPAEMCRDLDGGGFAKNAGIPADLSRLFANPWSARDRCRSREKSLNSGDNITTTTFRCIFFESIKAYRRYLYPTEGNNRKLQSTCCQLELDAKTNSIWWHVSAATFWLR